MEEGESIPTLPAADRLAKAYEDIRLKVEGLSTRPVVYLWTFGSVTFRKARAGFCQNLYSCAGFEVIEGKGSGDDATDLEAITTYGASWVVFCSSDKEYPDAIPAKLTALKESASKAVPVLAGYPTESIDALKAAGIADFIHIKTPALEYLTQCVDQLGAES